MSADISDNESLTGLSFIKSGTYVLGPTTKIHTIQSDTSYLIMTARNISDCWCLKARTSMDHLIQVAKIGLGGGNLILLISRTGQRPQLLCVAEHDWKKRVNLFCGDLDVVVASTAQR